LLNFIKNYGVAIKNNISINDIPKSIGCNLSKCLRNTFIRNNEYNNLYALVSFFISV